MLGRKVNYYCVCFLLLLSFSVLAQNRVELEVDSVWSGHRVGFALLTHSPYQYVAYYNAERKMVIAYRKLDESTWEYTTLPEVVEWDSHNYITMAMDDTERLHISGNMHVDSLVYFQMKTPLNTGSIERIHSLVGEQESRMTYPRFFRGPSNEFIFTYRDGSSGSGNQIYNVYNAQSQTWERLLDKPLTDGQGKMNAYIDGPTLGPDGRYHCVWVWRDTSDCATNHHLSYMRSTDLRSWENAAGETLTLPITMNSPGTVVDPVPPGGGLINGNAKLGFDGALRPVLTYHKYDDAGNSQVYNARWTAKHWEISQSTQWDSRWDFSGGGSIEFDVRVYPIKVDGAGVVTQDWSHWQLGRQRWELAPDSLKPIKRLTIPIYSKGKMGPKIESTFPGMQVRTTRDLGKSPDPDLSYSLCWETLGPNRDHPREKPWPEPSKLLLYTHFK